MAPYTHRCLVWELSCVCKEWGGGEQKCMWVCMCGCACVCVHMCVCISVCAYMCVSSDSTYQQIYSLLEIISLFLHFV